MLLGSGFELTEIADEYLVVPVGSNAIKFNGVVALNDAAAILIKKMKKDVSRTELVNELLDSYDLDKDSAVKDVDTFIENLSKMGIIEVN